MKPLVSILIIFQIVSFAYIVRTRPRIEFLPDNNAPEVVGATPMDKGFIWNRYKTDPQGFEYPRIRIYHWTFFSNENDDRNFLQKIFETDRHWEGRFTDMDAFIVNYGERNGTNYPLFDELKLND